MHAAAPASPDPRKADAIGWFPVVAGLAIAVVGFVVLIGWTLHLEPLKRIRPGLVAMNPFTAICFILAGAALIAHTRRWARARLCIAALAAPILALGGMRMFDYLRGVVESFDHLLFSEQIGSVYPPNHMAPNTAAFFILSGIALLTTDGRHRLTRLVRETALALLLLGTLLSLLGYLYGVRPFYGVLAFTPMALHTALCFLTLTLGVALARPGEGLAAVVMSPHLGGVLARRLLPAAVGTIVLLGWARIEGERYGLFESAFGVALQSVSATALIGVLIWLSALSLNRADARQAAAHRELCRAELNQELDSARLAVAAMQETLGVVSHELRTPVACMRLLAESMAEGHGLNEQDRRARVASIETVAIGMGETVDSILDSARASAGRLTWNWEQVDVKGVCTDAQVTMSALARERALSLATTFPPGLSMLRGDAGAIRRVVINLVANACKHTRRGWVRLEIARDTEAGRSYVLIRVRDSGDGMSPDVLARLGDPYVLGSSRMSRGISFGAGLGLSICRYIAAAHGGWMGVASRAGEGTIFSVRLAADLEAPVEIDAAPPPIRVVGWPETDLLAA